MSAQSLLARLGLRVATLGSVGSLAIAAPLAEGDVSQAAHTDASRIGVYFDRTLGNEGQSFVAMGVSRLTVGVNGVSANPRGLAHDEFFGNNSGNATYTGTGNTALGSGVLNSLTTGRSNVAMGKEALFSNTSGEGNTAIGLYSLYYNEVGYYNIAIGWQPLENNVIGNDNVAIGKLAANDTLASSNIAIGSYSLYTNVTGADNVAIGTNAGNEVGLLDMNQCVFLGSSARSTVNSVTNSIAIGYNSQVSGSNQCVLGNASITSTTLYGQVAFGDGTALLPSITFTGDLNTGIWHPGADTVGFSTNGAERMRLYNDGGLQVGGTFGTSPGAAQIVAPLAVSAAHGISGDRAVAGSEFFGYDAGNSTIIGVYNHGFGNGTLGKVTTGNRNNAFGRLALSELTVGVRNAAFGHGAMLNINGDYNVAVGCLAMLGAVSGVTPLRNVVIGYSAMQDLTTGSNDNVAVGYRAGFSAGSGVSNTFIGSSAGDGGGQKSDANNTIAIGYGVTTTADNQTIIGNASITQAILHGTVTTDASVIARAGLTIPHGTAPTAPVDGDFWSTTAGFYGRVSGVTVGPFGAGGGSIGGSIAANQIAVGSGSNTIGGSASLTATASYGGLAFFHDAGTRTTVGTFSPAVYFIGRNLCSTDSTIRVGARFVQYFDGGGTTSTASGISSDVLINPPVGLGSVDYVGVNSKLETYSNNNGRMATATMTGTLAEVIHQGTYNGLSLATMRGVQAKITVDGDGSSGTFTVTDVRGLEVTPTFTSHLAGPLRISTYAALYLGAPTITGTVLFNSRYGVYQADTSAENIFYGLVNLAGGLRQSIISVVADSVLTRTQIAVKQTATGITTTLWATPTTGDTINIRNASGGANVVAGNGTNIEGAATRALANGVAITLIYDGSQWTLF